MTDARSCFAVLLFVLFSAAPISSQATTLDGTVMTVLIIPSSTIDTTVERILTESALVFFEREGIEAVTADYELSGDEPTRRDITRLAREAGGDFVLLGTYTLAGETATALDVSFSLHLADSAAPAATANGRIEIDLSLDRSVASLLEILLDETFAYLAETDSQLLSDGSGSDEATATGAATTESGTSSDASDTDEVTDDAGARVAGRPGTLELGVGYVPEFAVGGASGYYQFAHGVGGYVHLIVGRRDGLGIGLSGSTVFASATGTATTVEFLIVPLALSATIRSSPTPFGVYLTLGGGGALIHVSNPVSDTPVKLAPYATGGVGMKVALLDWVGLNAGVTFDAVFEGSVLLTSFVPSVSLYLGF